jgi:serine/threonine protein kinase
MAWSVGKTLKGDQYTIQEVLGEGRFGITYRASDRLGNFVVIKTPRDVGFKVWESERLQALFRSEGIKLAKCQHSHIVQVKDLFQEGKANCLVMEYIDGRTLDKRSPRILSEKQALQYIEQIGQALMEVHRQGFLHRDIRPGNIMIRAGKPEAILIDFGLALDFDHDLTKTRADEMATGYAPIECYSRDAKRGAFTDIYSLGAMLYELLTGQVPISAMQREIDHQPLIEPKTYDSEISVATNKAILWAMELEANKRPQTMQEWFKNLGLSIPKKAESGNSKPIPINWTAVTATTGLLAVLLTFLTSIGVTEKIKQVLFPQPTSTVSPQPSPSSKP